MSFSTKFMVSAFLAQFMIASALPHGMAPIPVRHEVPTAIVSVPLTARGPTTCQPLTPDDVRAMPSWKKIEAYAFQQYGYGTYNLVTNPATTDVSGSPAALFCAPSNPVPLKVDMKSQSCLSSNNSLGGNTSGTDTTVSMTQKVGIHASTSMTISKFSSYTSSFSFGVNFGIPDTGLGISATTSFSSTVSSNITQSVESSFDTMQAISLTYTNKNGKKCNAVINTKSCQATASADIPLVATGVLWFEFNDRHAQKVGGDGSLHYKWAVSLEDALKDPNDRTSILSLNGKFQATSNTKSQYDVDCK